MDAKKVFVAIVLLATLALPSLAIFEKDVITPEAVQAVQAALRKSAPLSNIMLEEDVMSTLLKNKIVISNPIVEEALMKNSHGVNGVPCGESCVFNPCLTGVVLCRCSSYVCFKDSL